MDMASSAQEVKTERVVRFPLLPRDVKRRIWSRVAGPSAGVDLVGTEVQVRWVTVTVVWDIHLFRSGLST